MLFDICWCWQNHVARCVHWWSIVFMRGAHGVSTVWHMWYAHCCRRYDEKCRSWQSMLLPTRWWKHGNGHLSGHTKVTVAMPAALCDVDCYVMRTTDDMKMIVNNNNADGYHNYHHTSTTRDLLLATVAHISIVFAHENGSKSPKTMFNDSRVTNYGGI